MRKVPTYSVDDPWVRDNYPRIYAIFNKPQFGQKTERVVQSRTKETTKGYELFKEMGRKLKERTNNGYIQE